jgi:hypothetical protein
VTDSGGPRCERCGQPFEDGDDVVVVDPHRIIEDWGVLSAVPVAPVHLATLHIRCVEHFTISDAMALWPMASRP